MVVSERALWLAWSQVNGVGPISLMRLKRYFGTLAAAWDAPIAALAEVEGIGLQTAETIAQGRSRIDPEALWEEHGQQNPHFWTPADPNYPRLLLEIPDPPPVLYYRGKVIPSENQGLSSMVGIVGTRDPSEYGRRWTRRITIALANAGFTVVSGLAQGIDTEAHRSCVQAKGRTIAVLGTGVNIIYPWNNRALSRDIVQDGMLLSEYPANTQPDRVNFPRRNRIIAGLCRAILVLEAPQKSGALITARVANDYGRDVYVLPGSLDNLASLGCLELLNQGAQVILGEDHLLELLADLPLFQPERQKEQPTVTQLPLLGLTPQLDTVFQAVPVEPIAMDAIVGQAGLPVGEVLGALAQLELMGLVSQLPGMRYQRC